MNLDKEIIIVKNLLVSLDKKTNEDKLRIQLYSLMTSVLLSKSIFKKNSDISSFLQKCNIDFKEYVYRSRTAIIARTIRVIESSSKEELIFIVDNLKNVLFETVTDNYKVRKEPNNTNIADSILNQFGREK